MLVLVCLVISGLYLFHFIVLLNPLFSCSKNLLASSAERVTAGTYNFASFILNVASVGAFIAGIEGSTLGSSSLVALLVITQFSDQFKIKLISQLINSISSALQKFLRSFNGTTILTFFSILILSNLPVMLVL